MTRGVDHHLDGVATDDDLVVISAGDLHAYADSVADEALELAEAHDTDDTDDTDDTTGFAGDFGLGVALIAATVAFVGVYPAFHATAGIFGFVAAVGFALGVCMVANAVAAIPATTIWGGR